MGLSDSIFILEGSILNTFAPRLHTHFWNLVTFTEGWWKFACCLVSKWYISEFTGNWFLFLIINERKGKMYWEGSGRIFKLRNNFLHNDELNEVGGVYSTYGESRGVYRVLVGKPEGKRPLGRPGNRWGDNTKMDL